MQAGIMHPTLRFALDMGPLCVFFIAYRFAGLMAATGLLVAFTGLSLVLSYTLEKRIAPMPLISGVAVAVFGGITLWLNDDTFIKIKPTLVNLLFAAILLGGVWYKKPMLQYVLGSAVQMTKEGWLLLSKRWGFFFMFLAGLNEIIWRHFPTDFWVNFKVFGMFSLTMLFMLSQIRLMRRYAVDVPERSEGA